MRIAYFNANLRRGQDGVSRVVYKMMEGALERGHEVMAVTSTLPDEADRIVPMVRVPSVALPLQKVYRIALPCYHTFLRQLEEFRPDIIHLNSPCPLGFAASVYARDFDIPVVATYHTHFPAYTRYYKLDGLEELAWTITRLFYGSVDRTFVPALPILRELEERNLHGLRHVPNGVDLSLFSPSFRSDELRRSFRGGSDTPVVLFVSRLVWEKDLADLAQAYSILREKRNDFSMVIVGDGQARAEFEAMMPGATFLGFKSGRELSEIYASSDIFAFPSTTETFGLVTVEAMASGVVPVAAEIGGAAGIIRENESGLFAPPHDPPSLAQQIELLLDDPGRRTRMAANAVRRAGDFGWEKVLQQLFDNYIDVIGMHRFLKNRSAA